MNNEPKSLTIGFFYYNYFPITGGASVHGYNLAKELSNHGIKLIKINGQPDPFTQREKGLSGFIKTVMQSDIVFVRLDYFFKPRNVIPLVAKIFGKPVIAELNSPSDELLLFGYSKRYKWLKEKWMKFLVRYVDKLITVSNPVKEFCTEVLEHDKVQVIENGGEFFKREDLKVSKEFFKKIDDIRKTFSRIIIWTGTTNKIQETEFLLNVANTLEPEYALIVITPDKELFGGSVKSRNNIFQFSALSRDELGLAINNADVGLAFFTDYSWCKWGYYGSSLKVYEYLSNKTVVLTNKDEVAKKHAFTKLIENPSAINDLCKKINTINFNAYKPRTWNEVAIEFISAIKDPLEGKL